MKENARFSGHLTLINNIFSYKIACEKMNSTHIYISDTNNVIMVCGRVSVGIIHVIFIKYIHI